MNKSSFDLRREADLLLASGGAFETDEQAETFFAQVDAWAEEAGDKLLACRIIMEAADDRAAALRRQADRYLERARADEVVADRAKASALRVMMARAELTGEKRARMSDGMGATLVVRQNESAKVIDIDAVPAQFLRVAPKLDDIKRAHAAGEPVPGTVVEVSESRSVRWTK